LDITTFRQQTLQKYQSADSLNFCAIYQARNADKARTLGWGYNLTTNSVKFMQQTTSPLSDVNSSVCT